MEINKLELYLKEADTHIKRLEDVLSRVKSIYPLTEERFNKLSSTQMEALDTLAFRFSKHRI